MNEAILL